VAEGASSGSTAWDTGGSFVYDTTRQRIWGVNSANMGRRSFLDLLTRTFTSSSGYPGINAYPDMVYTAYCVHRDVFVIACSNLGETTERFYWFAAGGDGSTRTLVTFDSGTMPDARYGRGTLVYVPELRKIVYWTLEQTPDTYYEIDVPQNPANPWTWQAKAITGNYRPSVLSPTPYQSTYKRMDYAPQLKSLMWVTGNNTTQAGGRIVAIRVAPEMPTPTTIELWAENLNAGQATTFPAPTVNVADSTGSKPFMPPAASGSGTGTLDWCSNLPYDPVTKRFVVTGGRPAYEAPAQKLIFYDATKHRWDGVANPFGTDGGHIYQSQCVAASMRKFFRMHIGGDKIVSVWDLDKWAVDTPLPVIPTLGGDASLPNPPVLMWMPNMGEQGSLIVAGDTGTKLRVFRFDWYERLWSLIADFADTNPLFGLGAHFTGVYVPGADKCIFGASGTTTPEALQVLDNAGTLTATPVANFRISAFDGNGILTPHPSRDAAIHFDPVSDRIRSYEFASNTWVDRGALPAQFNYNNQIGGTIPELGIVASVYTPSGENFHMAIYKPDF